MKLKIKNVIFDTYIVLKKTSFLLDTGNLVALIGESGSGKSTIIDSITFENEFLESFVYQEKDYAKATKEEQQSFIFEHMGIVHQQPEFLKDLTIKLHIEMIKELYGIKEDEEIQDWISSLELKVLLEKYPDQLSGGEQIRCALLLALIHKPDILILDEPTSSLDEYHRDQVIQVLKEYANQGNIVLYSTHDSHLIEKSDVVYEIKNQELYQIKDDNKKETENNETQHVTKKHLEGINYYFRKMKKHQKLYHRIMAMLTIFCIGFTAFGFEFNNIAYAVQTQQMNDIASNELLVYKGVDRQGEKFYEFGGANELITTEEIEKIKRIDHIKHFEWRYDTEIFNSALLPVTDRRFSDADYRADPIEIQENKSIIKKLGPKEKGNQKIDSLYVCSYIKDWNYDNDIKYKFQNDGVYISMWFAQKIDSNVENLKGKEISFYYTVPTSDAYGKVWITNDNEEMFLHLPNTTKVKITLPIAGILEYANMGITNDYQDVVYMDRDIIEKYINQYKDDTVRTIYGMDTEYKKYYINDCPDDEKDKVIHEVKETPWAPTGYSVIVDDISHMGDVIHAINEIGLDVENGYMNYGAMRQNTKDMQTAIRIGSVILSVIIFLMYIVMKYNNRKAEQEINDYFKNIGFHKKEIKKIKRKKYIEESIFVAILSVIIFTALMFILNALHIGYTVYSLKMVVIILCLSLIFEAIIPMLIETKK
ncbi:MULTISPECIES: ATP-binding cassette domain-containing protein [Bacillota]|jgi:ABC-type lipoprotein export system ATPase subunit|uniref:ATP-binding cassette domain-containing protein n=4 Tax=Amedibacillus TaxID=2749846 RepID=A0A7G9GKY0_9FIRM|nr:MULTISPECIES: ATP-binding cassette domain-containing protein [Bacillota]QNM11462.1 ATP-binding cassette domain-containing protein [[Eubacterium] hominis]MCH4284522.1 ATP-binding cassette domain-containing protein [Amedibacillus hominis]RGB54692.1 ATP-binding cassette domain-containing protein [Absiella sp. AM22-9]RGB60432.1 ATP-binding cassette domain-containing protein [Absiella sp. AM10-20]RGB65824.1 ATP-binding cassette domain-containing protein [Absiella sp. AM09-45]